MLGERAETRVKISEMRRCWTEVSYIEITKMLSDTGHSTFEKVAVICLER